MYIFVTITSIWLIIYIIDNFLEHKLGFRYISWKFQKEVILKPFYIQWQNSKIGKKTFYDYNFDLKSKKYNHWFNCGVFATIVLFFYGYMLFLPPIFQLVRDVRERHFPVDQQNVKAAALEAAGIDEITKLNDPQQQ